MTMKGVKKFDLCLKSLLAVSGVTREELARRLDVPAPVVSRWLNGYAAPDVYQFRDIARFFGKSYDWFLDGGDGFPSAENLAEKLGLGENTVKAMILMTDSEYAEVMDAVNDAIWAVFSAVISADQLQDCYMADVKDEEGLT